MVRALVILLALAPAAAHAQRDPWSAPASSFARPGGRVRVHYVTTTADAVPARDADASGVPDFVEEMAARGDESLAAFAALGYRAPLGDGALGGDDRVDIYLRDLAGADGSFVPDGACSPTCAGSVTIENDFAGYAYPSVSIAIRVLASHELFHAVQAAYDADQPMAWSEGTAVWAEERLYPEQDDFERLTAGFIARFFRPFERPGGGFGDPYPYGAALWPYYLEQRHGADLVRAIWERGGPFLDAADAELAARGTSLAAAWIELARWIALTGAHATGEGFPEPERLGEPRRETTIVDVGTAIVPIEGMSARYVPLYVTAAARVAVTAATPVALDAVAHGDEVAIERISDAVIEVRPAGPAAAELTLIITGFTRGAPVQEVTLTVAPPPPEPESSGCNTTPAPTLLLGFLIPRARRRGTGRAA